MASDLYPIVEVVNGINFANYVPYPTSYNSVLYVNKKLFDKTLEKPQKMKKLKKEARKIEKEKLKKKNEKLMVDEGIQCNYEIDNVTSKDNKTYKVKRRNNSVLEQTIQIARNIASFVIPLPPMKEISPPPVFYMVNTTKPEKKHKTCDNSQQTQDVTYKKEKSKKVVETFRNEKIVSQREESFSVKETVSFASQNDTLDEIHLNPSLCCSLSEISDEKQPKKERVGKKPKNNDIMKFAASESFEAIATELVNQSGDAKINIHLLNDRNKNLLIENIKIPIVNALKDCILEMDNRDTINSELSVLQKSIKGNAQKLVHILDRLINMERKLDDHIKNQTKPRSPNSQSIKPSLDTLGDDLITVQESSEEELYEEDLRERKRVGGKSTVVLLSPRMNEEVNTDKTNEGHVENGLGRTSKLGTRPARQPARSCWTDARKNAL